MKHVVQIEFGHVNWGGEMEKRVGVLILHGVGIQKRNYSVQIKKGVIKALRRQNCDVDQVAFQEVLYTGIFEKQQRERSEYLIGASAKWQLFTRFMRWAFIHILSDAVSYRGRYQGVHDVISENVKELQKQLVKNGPVIIAAHSMGVIAISDYIYDHQNTKCPELHLAKINNLKALISFGCNIPLFEMGHAETVSIRRPQSDMGDKDFFWRNFYSPFDVLGYRIKKYYSITPDPTFSTEDEMIFSGGIFSKWNTACHTGYWSHSKIHECISDTIAKLLNKSQ